MSRSDHFSVAFDITCVLAALRLWDVVAWSWWAVAIPLLLEFGSAVISYVVKALVE